MKVALKFACNEPGGIKWLHLKLLFMCIMIKKILCPTDFSKNSEHALKYALALATLSQAELQLFHVVEPITCSDWKRGGKSCPGSPLPRFTAKHPEHEFVKP